MDVSEKKYIEKHLLNMFLTDEVLIDQHKSAISLTLLCGGVGIVSSTTTRTWISDATAAVTFSVTRFNPLKLLSSARKHLQKVVCFVIFLFIHEYLINIVILYNFIYLSAELK